MDDWSIVGGNELRLVDNGALHTAAEHGSVEVVAFLILSGWHINGFYQGPHGRRPNGHPTYRETPLYAAVSSGNVETAKFLLEKGAFANDCWFEVGPTPLSYAVNAGRHDMAGILLAYGADPQKSIVRGQIRTPRADKTPPIQVAARAADVDMAALLLHHGAEVDCVTSGHETALTRAVLTGCFPLIKLLVEEANANVNLGNPGGYTPLHLAVEQNSLELVKYFVQHGADLNILNSRKAPPLLSIRDGGLKSIEIASYLVQHGASILQLSPKTDTLLHVAASKPSLSLLRFAYENGANINATNAANKTPFHVAIRKAHYQCASFLIRHGADLLARDENGDLPLHHAVCADAANYGWREWREDADGLRFLANNCADISAMVNMTNRGGRNPLHIAASRGNGEAVHFLVNAGVDINAATNDGTTALHYLSHRKKDANDLSYLIKRGANLNAADNAGYTPLINAATKENIEAIKMLASSGADVNATDHQGGTALYRLAHRGASLESMKLLIKHGAKLSAQTSSGMTILHALARYRETETIDYVLRKGLDPNVKNDEGETALHYATKAGHLAVVQVFLKHGADPSIPSAIGLMPLHLAAKHECDPEISWALLKAAKLRLLEPSGQTSLTAL